jgi:hypothetical protein
MSTSTRATSRARSRPSTEDHVMVENIIRPQSRRRVDGPKYRAMRRALEIRNSTPTGLWSLNAVFR